MKLCIGTVQFGMDYGVQGGTKPSLENAMAMLDYATQNGVDAIDTAASYGTAEEVVGEFLSRKTVPRESVQVVTKFGTGIFDGAAADEYPARLRSAAETSLGRLRTDYVDAFICHVPSAAGDEAVTAAMVELKRSGLARHVGFSVYETDEAMTCLDSDVVDFMQAPFSVFDQRMAFSGALAKASARGVDVHTRSAFVQGLMLMDVEAIPPHLEATRPHVEALEKLCRENGVTRRTLALAYVKSRREISHLLFGVDSIAQLQEVVEDFNRNLPAEIVDGIAARFANTPADVFMPNKWGKGK